MVPQGEPATACGSPGRESDASASSCNQFTEAPSAGFVRRKLAVAGVEREWKTIRIQARFNLACGTLRAFLHGDQVGCARLEIASTYPRTTSAGAQNLKHLHGRDSGAFLPGDCGRPTLYRFRLLRFARRRFDRSV
jgi:hypothetical protein